MSHHHHPKPPINPAKDLHDLDRTEHKELSIEEQQLQIAREELQVEQATMGFAAEQLKVSEEILHELRHPQRFPTQITFTETPMLDPVAGNTLVYTGTLAPAGATFPTDTVFNLVSSDSTVTPTVDATGLIVTISLPATFVDNAASPFNVVYTATSASTSGSITATITPSVPVSAFPTGITFAQTT
jgi:hypothetical protein